MLKKIIGKIFSKKSKEKVILMSELKDGEVARVVGGDFSELAMGELILGHHVIKRGNGFVELERPDYYWICPKSVRVTPVYDVKQTQLAVFEEIHEGD